MSNRANSGFTNPGQSFVERFGPAQSGDDALHYVRFLREEAELSDNPPIDLAQIYARFQMPAPKRISLPNLQGMLLDPECGVILINHDDPASRQRFTEGHELMEFLFSALPSGKGWASHQTGVFKHDAKERLCNEGAAELLMPRSTFLQRVLQLGVSFETGRRLAREYEVSTTAALVQMARLTPGYHAVVLWQMKNKPTEIKAKVSPYQLGLFGQVSEIDYPKKLRVEWSLGGSPTNYIPHDKSVPEDSSVYAAWRDKRFTNGKDILALGSTTGKFQCENQPFESDGEYCVISLLHFPGDTWCNTPPIVA